MDLLLWGWFSFQVRLRIIPREEFEAIPRPGDRYELSHQKRLTIGGINADKEGRAPVLDAGLVGLFFYALPVFGGQIGTIWEETMGT